MIRCDTAFAAKEVMRDASNPTLGGQGVCSVAVGKHKEKNVERCFGQRPSRMSEDEMLNGAQR